MGHDDINIGTIEVITGPMFAGKSEELIRRIKRIYGAFYPDRKWRYRFPPRLWLCESSGGTKGIS